MSDEKPNVAVNGHFEDEAIIILHRLDERTKQMAESIEENERATQENTRKIARLKGGLVVLGILLPIVITTAVSYFLGII
jgi:hypothetical protein